MGIIINIGQNKRERYKMNNKTRQKVIHDTVQKRLKKMQKINRLKSIKDFKVIILKSGYRKKHKDTFSSHTAKPEQNNIYDYTDKMLFKVIGFKYHIYRTKTNNHFMIQKEILEKNDFTLNYNSYDAILKRLSNGYIYNDLKVVNSGPYRLA